MITYVTIPTAPLSGSALANSLGSGELIHVYVSGCSVGYQSCGGIPRELPRKLPRELPRPVVIESSSHAGDSGYSLILSLDF